MYAYLGIEVFMLILLDIWSSDPYSSGSMTTE